MYLVASIKHTKPHDKFIAIWSWGNCGYTFYLDNAGQYEIVENGYHDSEHNVPINQSMLDKLDKIESLNGFGEPVTGIANNTKNRKILGVKYVNNTLCKI